MAEEIIGTDSHSVSSTINKTGVTDSGHLYTESTVNSKMKRMSSSTGESFIITSDFISLITTTSFNGIIYIKNSSVKNLHIEKIRTCSSASGFIQVNIKRNPTTGTLISDANLANQLTSNYSSNIQFSTMGLAYSASADGKTITDGSLSSQFINASPGHSIQNYEGGLILGQGSSIAIEYKPSAVTIACCEVQCYFE